MTIGDRHGLFGPSCRDEHQIAVAAENEGTLGPFIETEHGGSIVTDKDRPQVEFGRTRLGGDRGAAKQRDDLGDDEDGDREDRGDDADATDLDEPVHRSVDQQRRARRLEAVRVGNTGSSHEGRSL